MQLVGIIAVFVILIIGIAQQNLHTSIKNTGDVHSAAIENSPTATPSPTEKPVNVPTIIVTIAPSTPTSTPTSVPQQSGDLNSFRYPGSSENSSDATSMHLTSSDSTDAITNWYKNNIKDSGYNSTAFAATNTNGNVLTKLAGSNGHTEIRVEITKNSGDSSTQITVTVHTY